jgi:DNA-binding response OmpR family regulator
MLEEVLCPMKRTSRTGSEKPTVLIAEDDEIMGRLVAQTLSEAGFRTRWVTNGVDAINVILKTRPELIVLDLVLPRLHGERVCSMVRHSAPVRHTPILVMSGCATLESKLRTYDLGADDYVTKPFDVTELIVRAEALWSRSRRHRFATPFLGPGWN